MRSSTRSTIDVDLNAIPLLLGPRVVPPAEVQPLTQSEKYALLAGQKIPDWVTTYDDILKWHDIVFEGEMNRRKKQKAEIIMEGVPPDLQTAEKLRELWRKRVCSSSVVAVWTQEMARATMREMHKNDPKCLPMLVRTLFEFGATKLIDVPDHKLPEFMALVQKNWTAYRNALAAPSTDDTRPPIISMSNGVPRYASGGPVREALTRLGDPS